MQNEEVFGKIVDTFKKDARWKKRWFGLAEVFIDWGNKCSQPHCKNGTAAFLVIWILSIFYFYFHCIPSFKIKQNKMNYNLSGWDLY